MKKIILLLPAFVVMLFIGCTNKEKVEVDYMGKEDIFGEFTMIIPDHWHKEEEKDKITYYTDSGNTFQIVRYQKQEPFEIIHEGAKGYHSYSVRRKEMTEKYGTLGYSVILDVYNEDDQIFVLYKAILPLNGESFDFRFYYVNEETEDFKAIFDTIRYKD